MSGLWLSLLAVVSSAFPESMPPLPPAMPKVVMLAPIDLAWAGEQAAYWREKGIDGFLADGVLDDPTGPLANADCQALPDSVKRLCEAGIDQNFVLVPLAPERPYFTDASLAERAVTAFAKTAAAAKTAGFRGLALDSRSASLFYDPLWDGYDAAGRSSRKLAGGARAFGRRVVRAFLSEYPEAELLVLGDGPGAMSAVWCGLFDGILDAARTSGRGGVSLLVRETCTETAADRLAARTAGCDAFLRLHLDEPNRVFWQRAGSVAPGLCPLARAGAPETSPGLPIASYPLSEYRVQLAAAKIVAPRFVWIDAAGQTWWRLTPDEVRRRGGRAAAQTASVVGNLAEYTARTPLDAMTRVGATGSVYGPAYVLRDQRGAFVLVWDAGGRPLTFDTSAPVVMVTDLANGLTVPVAAQDGSAAVPPVQGPLLAGPAPLDEWVSAAGLWCVTEPVPGRRGGFRQRVRYGFANRTDFTLSGTLQLVAPSNVFVSLKPQARFDLAPGGSIETEAVCGGGTPAGSILPWRVMAAVDGSPPVARDIVGAAPPPLLWQRPLDGPLLAPPVIDPSGFAPILLATWNGELAVLEGDGSPKWSLDFPCRFALPPVLQPPSDSEFHLAAVDTRGILRVIGPNRGAHWERRLGAACATPPIYLPMESRRDDVFFCAAGNGVYHAWRMDGGQAFAGAVEGGTCRSAAGAVPGIAGPVVFLAGGAPPVAAALLSNGVPLWRVPLEGIEPVCGLVLGDVTGDGADEIILGGAQGEIAALDARTGAPVLRRVTASGGAPIGVALGDLVPGGPMELVIACKGGLECMSGETVLWTLSAAPSTPPCIAGRGEAARILLGEVDGALTCLSAAGTLLWRDRCASAPPITTAMAYEDSRGRWTCLYAAGDRVLRAAAIE